MSDLPALAPSLVAAGGGSALLAGIHIYEHRRDAAMRASRVRLGVRFPVGLEPLRAAAALDGLAGLPVATEVISEVSAREGCIDFSLWVPSAVRDSVEASLRGVIPSLRVSEQPLADAERATLALRLFVTTPAMLQAEGAETTSRALLAGLAMLATSEQVVVRWALRVDGPRQLPAREPQTASEKEMDRAWQRKIASPGMRVSGLVFIRAGSVARARTLAGHVENVLRSRRGLTGAIRVTSDRGSRSFASLPKTTRTSGWLGTPELLGVLGWPLGTDIPMGVELGAARELMVPRHIANDGRVLFIGRDAAGPRPVALSAEATRHHLAVVGPTGVGKSALLANCVLSDIAAGFSGVVIDPKGPDLINAVLERIPPEDAQRITVLDPADPRPTPGVALLSGGDPDLRAEVLTGALRSIFADVWSVRSDYYARLGLRTLSEVPGATLADLGRLFFEDRFRRVAVARLSDPFLRTAWQHYEHALTAGARAEHVQAPMARVMALLNMPRVRAVLASPDPKLDLPKLLADERWLLVSLSPGQLGEGPANFIAAALIYVVWSAIEARAALAPEARTPLALYVDELASLTAGVPFSFEQLAERARGLGASIALSLQSLGRIGEPTRSSLLTNVASLVSFRATADDAARLSRELPGLAAADLMALGRFEVAARIGTGLGSAVTTVTGTTQPLPEANGQAEAIREHSAKRYGTASAPSAPADITAPDVFDPAASVGVKRRQV